MLPAMRKPPLGFRKLPEARLAGSRLGCAMSKKRFDHFMSFWEQVLRTPRPKATHDRRARRAKSRLRLALATR